MSVIIAVFNGMPYLPELLACLESQGLSGRQLEIIVVDDGSTDETPQVLHEFASRTPNTHIVHQPHSGWPGGPRNQGIERARSRYVFFADADDLLAPDALRDLVDFSDEHRCDLVLPRVQGLAGRRASGGFRRSDPQASLRTAFRTLTPHKLIRRELFTRYGFRFPEGKVRLEDGIVMSQCYLHARRIGILAERDYYFLRARADKSNISWQPIDPASYLASVEQITDYISTLAPPGRRSRLITDLFRRKCLKFYRPERFLSYRPEIQRRHFQAHHGYIHRHITIEMESSLPAPLDQRCALIRAGDYAALLQALRDELDQRSDRR